MLRVTLYVRSNCQLCDQARLELRELAEEFPHQVVELDIESDPALLQRYMEQIPIVKVGPYTLKAPFSATDLRVALAAARDGGYGSDAVTASRVPGPARVDSLVLFISRHWLSLFSLFLFLYVGLPFVAPVLMKAGATRPARWIYLAYSPLCHQLAYRSWFLFGERPFYPRDPTAQTLDTFETATGLDSNAYWETRQYVGDEEVGYKVALCQRDVGIYGSLLLAGLVFGAVRKRVKPLPIWAWIVFGLGPIALDGGSQLISGLGWRLLSWFPVRESTPVLRSLTGALFGVANIWLAYPYIEESMREMQTALVAKLAARSKPVPDKETQA